MGGKILGSRIFKDTKTIALMDEFEKKDENGQSLYQTLELSDIFAVKYNRVMFWTTLYVQRLPKGTEVVDSSLTFTDLKRNLLENVFSIKDKNSYKLTIALFESIKKVDMPKESKGSVEIIFDNPVRFNAQNSKNRSGYGNRYYFDELVYEGTPYGETTDYMFVGAKCVRW